MSSAAQVHRQWKIVRLLEQSRRGLSYDELLTALSADTRVNRRTIQRDLMILRDYFDIVETKGDDQKKRFRMEPLGTQLGFTISELMAIAVSRPLLEPLAGTPMWDSYCKVMTRIRTALGEQGDRYCRRVHGFVQNTGFGHSDYSQRAEIIDRLVMAGEDRRRALIVYQSAQSTEPVEQEVGPQGLVWHNGSLYLIAWSARRKEFRTYKVDRIESVDVSSELQYSVPKDFDLEQWKAEAFGVFRGEGESAAPIRIRFSRDPARYVTEGHWHATQQLEQHPDGSVTLSMRVTDYRSVVKWVLSFGPGATALEPPEFVEAVRNELQRSLDRYTDNTEVPR